jgi:heme-degrading monooxygenase HmoA
MSYVVVFRSRLRPEAEPDYERRAAEIYALGIDMPGFIAIKSFTADDGERVSIVEFDTAEHLAAWRDHAEHRVAQQQGRDRFYSEYSIQVCKVERTASFDGTTRRSS